MSFARKMNRKNNKTVVAVDNTLLVDSYTKGYKQGYKEGFDKGIMKTVNSMAHNTRKKLEDAWREGGEQAQINMIILFFLLLHDKFGFGKTRLERVGQAIHDLTDCVASGYVSIEEVQKGLVDEGFTFLKDITIEPAERDKKREQQQERA